MKKVSSILSAVLSTVKDVKDGLIFWVRSKFVFKVIQIKIPIITKLIKPTKEIYIYHFDSYDWVSSCGECLSEYKPTDKDLIVIKRKDL